jgi:hypothetical protein
VCDVFVESLRQVLREFFDNVLVVGGVARNPIKV